MLSRMLAPHMHRTMYRCMEDSEKLVEIAKEINSSYRLVETVDVQLVSQLSWTSAGLFPPLATAIGGLVAQEALISLTGKFSPLRQWVRREGGREGGRERGSGVAVLNNFSLHFYTDVY